MCLAPDMYQSRDFLKLLLNFYVLIGLVVSDQNLSEGGHFLHQKHRTCSVRSTYSFKIGAEKLSKGRCLTKT